MIKQTMLKGTLKFHFFRGKHRTTFNNGRASCFYLQRFFFCRQRGFYGLLLYQHGKRKEEKKNSRFLCNIYIH